MSKSREYEERTEQLLTPVMEENHFELVDVEYVREAGNWYLRAYVDKEGGITIDDCELVSRALSERLDEEDFIPDSYILEVSSPGLGRQLKKDKDFQRSLGEEVEVKLYQGISEKVGKKEVRTKEWFGILKAFDDETVTLEPESGEAMVLERKNIAIIKLALDF